MQPKLSIIIPLYNAEKYISACNVEVKDPLGSKFDPGLAVEVVNNEAPDLPEEELIIIETLAHYIYQDGELIQYARVIIGSEIKEVKQNNEIKEETAAEPAKVQVAQPKKNVPNKKKSNNKSKKKKKKNKKKSKR